MKHRSTPRYKQNRLQQLRGFCATARTGSISRAANELFLSQPSVSLQIQALERELDVQLLERHGPKIGLTPDGEALYELAWPLVQGMDSLADAFAARRGTVDRGRIDIAAGGSTILYVLPPFVERFVQAHPRVEFRIHNVTGKDGLALLRAGEVDFAVGPLLDTPEDLEFQPVFSYDAVLITPPNHPLAKKAKVNLRDIAEYPLILPPRHLSTWRMVEMVFAEHKLNYEVRLEVGGWEVIKKYVELGMGVSVVMSICITGEEKLAVIPVEKYFPRRTYGVVMRRGQALSAPARRFIEMMTP